MARVEATMASCEFPPARARKAYCKETHADEVDQDQRRGEGGIDQGTVDDPIYIVEPVPQYGDAGGHGDRGNENQARPGGDRFEHPTLGPAQLPEHEYPG